MEIETAAPEPTVPGTAVRSARGGARVRVPPPLVYLGALAAGAAADRAAPARVALPRWAGWALGGVLLAGALGLGLPAFRWFRRTGQHPAPWLPSPSLIEAGPYRFTRNPLYLGMTALAAGVGVAARSWWIVGAAPLALLAVHYTAVLPEEAYLAHRFGDDYARYRARVRRYV